MRWFLASLFIAIAPPAALAQGTSVFSQLQDTTRVLAQQQFHDCVKDEKNCQLPADVLTTLTSPPIGDPSQGATCAAPTPTPSPSENDGDTVQTEILFVADLGNFQNSASSDRNTPMLYQPMSLGIDPQTQQYLIDTRSQYTSDEAWIEAVEKLVGAESDPDLQQRVRNTFLTDLLIQNAYHWITDNPSIKEDDLAQRMADAISGIAKTDDEKITMLSALSDHLYDVYNDSRNPGQNKDGSSQAAGNLSLADEVNASYTNNSAQGGVCNDISQAVATAAAKLLPAQDALVINNGSHFVVLLNDKNNRHTVIDGDFVHQGTGDAIFPGSAASNTRISKVVDGKLKEIAVTDTEVGAVFNKLFGTPRPTLATGVDPNVAFATLKKEYENRNHHAIETGIKLGVAQTSASKMIVFVGERKSSSKHGESHVGYGIAFRQQGIAQEAIFALHDGFSRNLIRYVSPRVTLKVSTGVEVEGEVSDLMHVKGYPNPHGGYGIDAFSMNGQLIQKASVETHPKNPNRPSFSGDAQLIHSLGVGNWGAHQGVIQNPGASSILKSMKYMNLHLNQVFTEGTLNVPLTRTLASQTHAQYQGSNVGQKIDLTSGVQIQSTGGMKIFAFVGYAANLKGYQTQHNLLYHPAGLKTGAEIQTKKGVQISTQIQGIGGGQKPIGNLNIAIPILKKSSPKK